MRKGISILLSTVMIIGMVSVCACTKNSDVTVSSGDTSVVSVSDDKTENVTSESKKDETAASVSNTETENKEEKTEVKEETKAPSTEFDTTAIIELEFKQKEVPDNDALNLVKELGAGFNLGNTFDANDGKKNVTDDLAYETLWGNPKTTKENIQGLKAAGFNTIRIPVSWHNHVDENFNIRDAWMDRVEEVVKWALEEDMYVILNIHHDNIKGYMYPSYEELDTSKKYVEAIWKQVAKRFGDYDEHLIFESLNEPRAVDTSYEWYITPSSAEGKESIDCVNQLNQIAVDTIRSAPGKYNKSRFITVPGYCASPDYILCEGFEIPSDTGCDYENRILLTVHAYRPYNFALSSDSDATDRFSAYNPGYDISTMCSQLYNKYVKNGVGIVIDEFGAVDRGGNIKARTHYAAYYTGLARSHGMSVCWWDNGIFSGSGELFGIYRRKTNEIEYPSIVNHLVYYSK